MILRDPDFTGFPKGFKFFSKKLNLPLKYFELCSDTLGVKINAQTKLTCEAYGCRMVEGGQHLQTKQM